MKVEYRKLYFIHNYSVHLTASWPGGLERRYHDADDHKVDGSTSIKGGRLI